MIYYCIIYNVRIYFLVLLSKMRKILDILKVVLITIFIAIIYGIFIQMYLEQVRFNRNLMPANCTSEGTKHCRLVCEIGNITRTFGHGCEKCDSVCNKYLYRDKNNVLQLGDKYKHWAILFLLVLFGVIGLALYLITGYTLLSHNKEDMKEIPSLPVDINAEKFKKFENEIVTNSH